MMQRRSDKRKSSDKAGATFLLLLGTASLFDKLCINDRPPPLRVTLQIEDRFHAFHAVLDHGLRPGAVHLEARDPEVRLRTHVSILSDPQRLTEPRWCDTRLQQVVGDDQRHPAGRLGMEVRGEHGMFDDQFEHWSGDERL